MTAPHVPHVLIVEDRQDDVFLLRRAIGAVSPGLEVRHVSDARSAFEQLESTHPSEFPMLVLVDLKLPGMGGVELIGRVRGDHRYFGLPMVALSTSTQATDVAAAYDAGANSYIVKPIRYEDLMHLMSTTLEYWGRLNVLPSGPLQS